MLQEKWEIVLLNGFSLHQGVQTIQRFRTQKTGELLAFLALNLHRAIPREELAEKIWPESDTEAARTSLRTALASLRHQLEPPGTPANSVLVTDRASIRLRSEAVTTDIEAFDAACRAEAEAIPETRLQAGIEAVRLYSGELLPGCYSDWVFHERDRLSQTNLHLLRSVISGLWKIGEKEQALEYARRLIAADPLREEAYVRAMRLYAACGRPTDALRCFQNWKRLLSEELGETPSPAAVSLAEQIAHASGKTLESSALSARRAEIPPAPPEAPVPDRESSEQPQRETPTVASTEARPTVRLPLTLTQFFGRETEIMEIAHKLSPQKSYSSGRQAEATARLVTLTGAGGAGKTRLAVEVAKRIAGQSRHAVTFVPLAEIREPERLLEAIANALALSVRDHLLEAIVSSLSTQPHLLVLDNFEQLLTSFNAGTGPAAEESASLLVHTLLERAPRLQCLVTSRQCLEIEGEREYLLQPLATPAYAGTPERLLEFASVQLFVDRAQAARPDFQLTPRNAEVISTLCTRLEGLPLALELAAAWSSVLSPAQILERLSQRFDLLVSRRKGRLSRHQTLRAAIEWSYRLLPPDLQTFFARLSVFRGGWTAEAAEAVCEESNAHENLQALRDRSLVTVEESVAGETEALRFRLLETLREFAEEQVSEEERIELHRRHLKWYDALAEKAADEMNGANEVFWLKILELDRMNLWAALQWSLKDPNGAQSGLHLFGALSQFWYVRSNYAEVRALADQLLNRTDAQDPTAERAAALMTAGVIAGYQADLPASIRYQEQSLQIMRQIGDPFRLGVTLFNLGGAMISHGDLEAARRYYDESRHHYQIAGKEIGVALSYGALGYLAGRDDDLQNAILYDLKALEILRKLNQCSSITHFSRHLGILYVQAGQSDQARDCFYESLQGYNELKDTRGLADMLRNLVHLSPISEASARLMGAAQALNAMTTAAPLQFDGDVERGRAFLGDAAFETAWNQGGTFTLEQAIEEGRVLLAQKQVLSLTHPEFVPTTKRKVGTNNQS